MLTRRLALALGVLVAFACSKGAPTDSLVTLRHNLRRFRGCTPNTKKLDSVAVAGVSGPNKNPREVFLQDWLMVSVCNVETLIDLAENAQKPVTLFIEGIDTGIEPSGRDLQDGTLTFILDRNEQNKPLFQPLLYDPIGHPTAVLHVSVGIHGDKPLSRATGADTTLSLQKIIFEGYTLMWLAFVALVIAILVVSLRSDVLRDGPTIGGVKQPVSLGRTQMAWWFVLILTGFVFIWAVTGDRDTIPASLLGLMGISAGTALAAVAIGSRGEGQANTRRKIIDAELLAIATASKDIDDRLADQTLASVHPILKEKKGELETRRGKLLAERATLTTLTESGGWWHDLITDDNGSIGLDRLQILVWTLILGFMFLWSVLNDLTMPVFSDTMLALMGISSGTYIGFKLPAKNG